MVVRSLDSITGAKGSQVQAETVIFAFFIFPDLRVRFPVVGLCFLIEFSAVCHFSLNYWL